MRTRVVVAAVALSLAGAGTWAVLQWHRAEEDVQAVTAAPDSPGLSAARIAEMLASPDFKERIQARRQIDRLPERERVEVLAALSTDERAEVRMLAVSGMEALRSLPRVRDLLSRLAAGDPDPDVRASAGKIGGGTP